MTRVINGTSENFLSIFCAIQDETNKEKLKFSIQQKKISEFVQNFVILDNNSPDEIDIQKIIKLSKNSKTMLELQDNWKEFSFNFESTELKSLFITYSFNSISDNQIVYNLKQISSEKYSRGIYITIVNLNKEVDLNFFLKGKVDYVKEIKFNMMEFILILFLIFLMISFCFLVNKFS